LSQANHTRFRAGRNDVTTSLFQIWQRETRHHKCRANVHPNCFIEIGDRVILGHRVIEKNAGVVNQHIEPLKFFDAEIDALPGRMFLRNISAKSERFAAMVANRLRDIFDGIVRQSAYNYARSFLRELMCNGFADAGARSGHDRHLFLQSSFLFFGPVAAKNSYSHIINFAPGAIFTRMTRREVRNDW
jgi:hypothetical protein